MKTEKGNKFIIAATDHLTRWRKAQAVKNKSAQEVAKFLFKEVILRHKTSKKLVSNQRREFTNAVVINISKRVETIQSFTSAYHP